MDKCHTKADEPLSIDELRERRLEVAAKNAATRFIRELRLARGTPLAKAIPAICAHLNIPLDRDALEALGLPLDQTTVH